MKALTFISVCKAITYAKGSKVSDNDLFYTDIQSLENLYTNSTHEIRSHLAALIDKFFLLVNHYALTQNTEHLHHTLELLNRIFFDEI